MLEVANEYVHAQNQYYYSHDLDIKIFEKSTLHGSLESVYNSPMGVHNGDGLICTHADFIKLTTA